MCLLVMRGLCVGVCVCVCVCGLNKGEELWYSLEVNQFGNKRNDEKEKSGEVEQEDQGETIHLRHT